MAWTRPGQEADWRAVSAAEERVGEGGDLRAELHDLDWLSGSDAKGLAEVHFEKADSSDWTRESIQEVATSSPERVAGRHLKACAPGTDCCLGPWGARGQAASRGVRPGRAQEPVLLSSSSLSPQPLGTLESVVVHSEETYASSPTVGALGQTSLRRGSG